MLVACDLRMLAFASVPPLTPAVHAIPDATRAAPTGGSNWPLLRPHGSIEMEGGRGGEHGDGGGGRRPVLVAIVNGQRLEGLEEDEVSLRLAMDDGDGLVCQASIGDASPCQV